VEQRFGKEIRLVITCVIEHQIDEHKVDAFEQFARMWLDLVDRHGGAHHGYFLPAEGAAEEALALFSFESLAAYEAFRARFASDPEILAATRFRDESGCVVRYRRTFMRPVLPAR
jgi:NIPSNAP